MFSGEALTIYSVEDYLAKFVGHVAPGQLSYVFLLLSSTYSVLLAAGGKKYLAGRVLQSYVGLLGLYKIT